MQQIPTDYEPLIPASENLPEFTPKAIILSVILTIVLAAANAFLGLKVGITISASIPAAVMSMGILRFFRNSNVLENNIVQTCASAGEALTSGAVFTLPALIVIGAWTNFEYWPTVMVAGFGGIMGVLFSIPLRRVLLSEKQLGFPEGTAIGNVLKASTMGKVGLESMIAGGIIGAVISFLQTGLQVLSSTLQVWWSVGRTVVGGGVGFSPALLGAGYIIGPAVACALLVGFILGWLIGVPIVAYVDGIPQGLNHTDIAMALWDQQIRYVGVGTMVVGGLSAVLRLAKPVYLGLKTSLLSIGKVKEVGLKVPRTEQDVPIIWVLLGLILLVLPIGGLLYHEVSSPILQLSLTLKIGMVIAGLLFVFIGGFILASICGYFAGLVGTSTNPLSSMALIALICASLIIMVLLGSHINWDVGGRQAIEAAAIAIILTGIISANAGISNDNIQDLKAGHIVGATPWKQQVMLLLGVVVAAFVVPAVLRLLFQAYGIAGVFPRPGMDPSQMLLAPQAGLMSAVVQGIFTHDVNWLMLSIGGVIGILTLIAEQILLRLKGWRLPVLALGLGIYFPVDTSTPLIIGGFLAYFSKRKLHKRVELLGEEQRQVAEDDANQTGLLLACGLVAGAALMGVALAVPFAIFGDASVMRILPKDMVVLPSILGLVVTLVFCRWVMTRVSRI